MGTRRKRALRQLQRSLKSTDALTIETIGEAMEQYLMAKLGWERSQLTREAVKQHLTVKDEALAEQWDVFWEACEMQRYGASQGNLDALAQTLLTLGETTESRWS